MNWSEVQPVFDRALRLTYDGRRLLLAFVALAATGLLVIFCHTVAAYTGNLVALSLVFMPVFLGAMLLLSAGILLVRLYHDQVKQKRVSINYVFWRSWELMVGASYFGIPLLLSYLILWMLLALFYLLKEIPLFGDFFAVVLIFGPFLLNVGSVLLVAASVAMLFFITPMIALRGLSRSQVSQALSQRFQADLFSNLMLLLMALLPLAISLGLLHAAWCLTEAGGFMTGALPQLHVQLFILMIPYTACLAPAVVFFFNFATEAHVLMRNGGSQ